MLTESEREQGFIQVETWVAVDAEETVWAHEDIDCLKERMADDGASITRRVVRLILKLKVPVEIEVEATLPDEATEATVTVK